MSQDPPDHFKQAVISALGILAQVAPDLFESSKEGMTLTLSEGTTMEELLILLEERKPGITEDLEMILGAGRHPEQ